MGRKLTSSERAERDEKRRAERERRAKNVYNYLTEKLDNKNQISYKAYGNKKPIYIGNDENMKKINRRIEFRVIGL